MGAREYIHNELRYCLWLVNATPNELRQSPFIYDRVSACQNYRKNEGNASDTIALAETPSLFRETKNPQNFVVIPEVSSENRKYIPIGFLHGDVIPTNKLQIIENASLFEMCILSSNLHMAWMRDISIQIQLLIITSHGQSLTTNSALLLKRLPKQYLMHALNM